MTKNITRGRIALLVAIVLLAYAFEHFYGPDSLGPSSGTRRADSRTSHSPDDCARVLRQAFADKRSGFMVTCSATIERLLPDDREGSRHQRFTVRLAGRQTLLVSHNIDVAPRIAVDLGDIVTFRGQYEWNVRGGVIHWTHHDPDGRHEPGWIDHGGRRYE